MWKEALRILFKGAVPLSPPGSEWVRRRKPNVRFRSTYIVCAPDSQTVTWIYNTPIWNQHWFYGGHNFCDHRDDVSENVAPPIASTVIDIVLCWCWAERTFLSRRIIRAPPQYIRTIRATRQYIALRLKLSDSASPRRASRHSATDTSFAAFFAKLSIWLRLLWCTEPKLYFVFSSCSVWRHIVHAYSYNNGCCLKDCCINYCCCRSRCRPANSVHELLHGH